jgi:hypothetical protein
LARDGARKAIKKHTRRSFITFANLGLAAMENIKSFRLAQSVRTSLMVGPFTSRADALFTRAIFYYDVDYF